MTSNHMPTKATEPSIPNNAHPPVSSASLRLLEIPPERWDAIEKLTAELERIAALAKARLS